MEVDLGHSHVNDSLGSAIRTNVTLEAATFRTGLGDEVLALAPEFSKLRHARSTKIIPTLGPASNSEEVIRELVRAGANAFRLNFSHGTHEQHAQVLSIVRKVAQELEVPVAVIQDLQGPKMRLSEMPVSELRLNDGECAYIRRGKYPDDIGSQKLIFTEAFDPESTLKVGEPIFLADAQIELEVTKIGLGEVEVKVKRGGSLRSKAGIAIPDSKLPETELTKKDLNDLAWGIANNIDYIVLSFVSGAQTIKNAREQLRLAGRTIPLGAKIETKAALINLEEIINEADFVIVARGDLGVHIPYEKVPGEQRRIVELCNKLGKPVIVYTQMLPSMVDSPVPRRSDVTDVYNAAQMGADGLGLSEETAIGKYPIECVRAMARIAEEGESAFNYEEHLVRMLGQARFQCDDIEAVAISACAASRSRNVDAIIVFSESGKTSRLIAKYRAHVPVYAFSTNPWTAPRMGLYWGVNPDPLALAGTDLAERELVFRRQAEKFFVENPKAIEFGAIIVIGKHSANPLTQAVFEIKRISRQACLG